MDIMKRESREKSSKKTNSTIPRSHAAEYILTSLIAFAGTVIITRAFLQLTGYPQIGNSVLHIAHALWGGLLLIIAAYLPLAYANRWAFQASAVLGGIGIGLFIDEVGKFITQANDYFFPPALPLIYGFILLNILVYLYFRGPHSENPRSALYHALEGLQDLMDGDLDATKGAQIEAQLAIARRSKRAEIVSLANAISDYLQQESGHFSEAEPGFWKRITLWIDAAGLRIDRRVHRLMVTTALVGWLILVVGYISVIIRGGTNIEPQVLQWRVPLIGIQVAVGIFMVVAVFFWLSKREEQGLKFGVSGFLISLVALQLLYFYLSQFSAITATLLQLTILGVMFTYRRWYLSDIKG
jgi:hypothetical protein